MRFSGPRAVTALFWLFMMLIVAAGLAASAGEAVSHDLILGISVVFVMLFTTMLLVIFRNSGGA